MAGGFKMAGEMAGGVKMAGEMKGGVKMAGRVELVGLGWTCDNSVAACFLCDRIDVAAFILILCCDGDLWVTEFL